MCFIPVLFVTNLKDGIIYMERCPGKICNSITEKLKRIVNLTRANLCVPPYGFVFEFG